MGFNGKPKRELKFHIIMTTIFKFNNCYVFAKHYQGSQCNNARKRQNLVIAGISACTTLMLHDILQ